MLKDITKQELFCRKNKKHAHNFPVNHTRIYKNSPLHAHNHSSEAKTHPSDESMKRAKEHRKSYPNLSTLFLIQHQRAPSQLVECATVTAITCITSSTFRTYFVSK